MYTDKLSLVDLCSLPPNHSTPHIPPLTETKLSSVLYSKFPVAILHVVVYIC